MNKEKVGTLDGKAVYHSEESGWLIRSKHSQVLQDMTRKEVGNFMTQPIKFLGQYDYETSKQGGRK